MCSKRSGELESFTRLAVGRSWEYGSFKSSYLASYKQRHSILRIVQIIAILGTGQKVQGGWAGAF